MDSFLWEIKNIADSSVAINAPLTDQELVQYTIDGLDYQYEIFITEATYFGGKLTFDELRLSSLRTSLGFFISVSPPLAPLIRLSLPPLLLLLPLGIPALLTAVPAKIPTKTGGVVTTTGVEVVTIEAMVVAANVVRLEDVGGTKCLSLRLLRLGEKFVCCMYIS